MIFKIGYLSSDYSPTISNGTNSTEPNTFGTYAELLFTRFLSNF